MKSLGKMNIQVTKYKWKVQSYAFDNVKFKSNLEFIYLTIIKKKFFFKIRAKNVCDLEPIGHQIICINE